MLARAELVSRSSRAGGCAATTEAVFALGFGVTVVLGRRAVPTVVAGGGGGRRFPAADAADDEDVLTAVAVDARDVSCTAGDAAAADAGVAALRAAVLCCSHGLSYEVAVRR